MKHNFDEPTMQAAIDAALSGNSITHFTTINDTEIWKGQGDHRLDLLKTALANLPEPPPPVVDGKTPEELMQSVYYLTPSAEHPFRKAASAVLAAFGNKPAEIPWTEWHGGECPLDTAMVVELEYKMRSGSTDVLSPPMVLDWNHYPDSPSFEVIAYRVTKWKEGFGPQAVPDLCKHFEKEAMLQLTRAEKAESELAPIVAAATEAGWNGVENSKDLAQLIKELAEEVGNRQAALLAASTQIDTLKAQADRWFNQSKAENGKYLKAVEQIGQLQQANFSTLRPIAEAGEVPAGCVRVGVLIKTEGYVINPIMASPNYFADIRLPESKAPEVIHEGGEVFEKVEPVDPYAELKAAHAEDKVIQWYDGKIWIDHILPDNWEPIWIHPIKDLRIKPTPETFTAHGKEWTRHVPGDPMPCDGEAVIHHILEWQLEQGDEEMPQVIAGHCKWDASLHKTKQCIVGWRYADEPSGKSTSEATITPWTPAVGDVVTIKSGGPKLTVVNNDGTKVTCFWFNPSLERTFGDFPVKTLTKADS